MKRRLSPPFVVSPSIHSGEPCRTMNRGCITCNVSACCPFDRHRANGLNWCFPNSKVHDYPLSRRAGDIFRLINNPTARLWGIKRIVPCCKPHPHPNCPLATLSPPQGGKEKARSVARHGKSQVEIWAGRKLALSKRPCYTHVK